MTEQLDTAPRHIDEQDWSAWRPGILSTLVMIRRGEELLLIQKKTGLGQGKVNGPGGKLEPDEGWLDCARREVAEELKVTVGELWWGAELRFLMSDCPDILCHAFFTDSHSGVPTETREAAPFWSLIREIPWAQMWEDDQYWLPRALLGERVLGSFSFEGDQLLSMSVLSHPTQARDARPPERA